MLSLIRSHFPALSRSHNGFPAAYFDGPGGTQVPYQVAAAMSHYLFHHNANDGWAFPTSLETDTTVKSARRAFADLLNADPSEIAFGQNMTSLTFHVSRALGRQFQPGDEIITTELDHHANVDPWKQLARDRGLTIRTARMITETGRLDWPHFESLVNSKTRLIAIGAASNALGTINDISRATQLARSANALTYVDAVHYAPHHLIDVKAWDCDFLACSAYKFYGPHIGALYGKAHLLESLDVHKLEPAPSTAPGRLETGTQSFESMAGATAAIDFIASLADGPTRRQRLAAAFHSLHEASSQLFARLYHGLQSHPKVTTFGPEPAPDRAPTISFAVDGFSARDFSTHAARAGLFLSHGNYYALTAIRRLGYEQSGLIRVGLACYNSQEEIDRLLNAIP